MSLQQLLYTLNIHSEMSLATQKRRLQTHLFISVTFGAGNLFIREISFSFYLNYINLICKYCINCPSFPHQVLLMRPRQPPPLPLPLPLTLLVITFSATYINPPMSLPLPYSFPPKSCDAINFCVEI